jgi:hypothetical protein
LDHPQTGTWDSAGRPWLDFRLPTIDRSVEEGNPATIQFDLVAPVRYLHWIAEEDVVSGHTIRGVSLEFDASDNRFRLLSLMLVQHDQRHPFLELVQNL